MKKFDATYIDSQVERGNLSNIAQHIRPSSAVKEAFKSKIGLAGIAIATGENVYKNINSNESPSKVFGDAAVDVGIGAGTLALGAVVGAGAVALGAPVLVAGGAGFVFSVVSTYVLDGIKIGKEEKSASDALKGGVVRGIKTVAGWFK